jgi:hypothetical protein
MDRGEKLSRSLFREDERDLIIGDQFVLHRSRENHMTSSATSQKQIVLSQIADILHEEEERITCRDSHSNGCFKAERV